MREYRLSKAEVATILGVKPVTVSSWITPPGRPFYRQISTNNLKLLEIAIREQGNDSRRIRKKPI